LLSLIASTAATYDATAKTNVAMYYVCSFTDVTVMKLTRHGRRVKELMKRLPLDLATFVPRRPLI
jgi:hypothetical protein